MWRLASASRLVRTSDGRAGQAVTATAAAVDGESGAGAAAAAAAAPPPPPAATAGPSATADAAQPPQLPVNARSALEEHFRSQTALLFGGQQPGPGVRLQQDRLQELVTSLQDDTAPSPLIPGFSIAGLSLGTALWLLREHKSCAEQIIASGLPGRVLACMGRCTSDDIITLGGNFFFSLGRATSWRTVADVLFDCGPQASMAALACAVSFGLSGGLAVRTISFALNARPELAWSVAANTAVLETAVGMTGRLVNHPRSQPPPPLPQQQQPNPPHQQQQDEQQQQQQQEEEQESQESQRGNDDALEEALASLLLLSNLAKSPDTTALNVVASTPDLAPTMLSVLRAAHAAGRESECRAALTALSQTAEPEERRLPMAVAASGDDDAIRVILRVASDADDDSALPASMLLWKLVTCPPGTPLPAALQEWDAVLPALLAAGSYRAAGDSAEPTFGRQLAIFLCGCTMAKLIAEHGAARSKFDQIAPPAASDLIAWVVQMMDNNGRLASHVFPSGVLLLRCTIEACVNAGQLTALTGVPEGLGAVAYLILQLVNPTVVEPFIDDVLGLVKSLHPLARALRAAQGAGAAAGSGWTQEQLEDLLQGTGVLMMSLGRLLKQEHGHVREWVPLLKRELEELVQLAATAPAEQQQQQEEEEEEEEASQSEAHAAAPAADSAGPPAPAAAASTSSGSATAAAYACGHCGATEGPGGAKLRLCRGCRSVRYCSNECATAAWRGHKQACRVAQQ